MRLQIFVSSTITEHRDLRATLATELERLGHEAIVAERGPGSTKKLTETCEHRVRDSDLLILLLGKSAGSPVGGKWLTELEYRTARKLQKPCLVAVQRETKHAHALWRQNGRKNSIQMDVDAGVLYLIDAVEKDQQWMLPYQDAEDLKQRIATTLSEVFAQELRATHSRVSLQIAQLLTTMQEAYRGRHFVQALLAAEEIVKIAGDHPDALVTRAVCKIRLHGLADERAIAAGLKDCDAALKTDPAFYRALYNKANFTLLSRNHSAEEAEALLDGLFRRFPEYRNYYERDEEFATILGLKKSWMSGPKRWKK